MSIVSKDICRRETFGYILSCFGESRGFGLSFWVGSSRTEIVEAPMPETCDYSEK